MEQVCHYSYCFPSHHYNHLKNWLQFSNIMFNDLFCLLAVESNCAKQIPHCHTHITYHSNEGSKNSIQFHEIFTTKKPTHHIRHIKISMSPAFQLLEAFTPIKLNSTIKIKAYYNYRAKSLIYLS